MTERPLETRVGVSAGRNARTRIGSAVGMGQRRPLWGLLAFVRYESALRTAAETLSRDHVFIACVDSDGRPGRSTTLAPGQRAIFGRHEQVELAHADLDVSLRHLAIAVAPEATADAPLVRVWDLATSLPFALEGGEPARAISATGPCFLAVGGVHVAIVPLGALPVELPLSSQALFEAIPVREVVSLGVQDLPPEPASAARRKKGPDAMRRTLVTRLPGADGLNECAPEDAVGRIEVETTEWIGSYPVSRAMLERGVLVGRYDRCLRGAEWPDSLSRVHLLIALVGEVVVAIDTASTHGTTASDRRPFQVRVLEREDALLLAGAVLVSWVGGPRFGGPSLGPRPDNSPAHA